MCACEIFILAVYTVSQKKTCHYVFDLNLNKNCLITVVCGAECKSSKDVFISHLARFSTTGLR